jgi:hypothetical protein
MCQLRDGGTRGPCKDGGRYKSAISRWWYRCYQKFCTAIRHLCMALLYHEWDKADKRQTRNFQRKDRHYRTAISKDRTLLSRRELPKPQTNVPIARWRYKRTSVGTFARELELPSRSEKRVPSFDSICTTIWRWHAKMADGGTELPSRKIELFSLEENFRSRRRMCQLIVCYLRSALSPVSWNFRPAQKKEYHLLIASVPPSGDGTFVPTAIFAWSSCTAISQLAHCWKCLSFL